MKTSLQKKETPFRASFFAVICNENRHYRHNYASLFGGSEICSRSLHSFIIHRGF